MRQIVGQWTVSVQTGNGKTSGRYAGPVPCFVQVSQGAIFISITVTAIHWTQVRANSDITMYSGFSTLNDVDVAKPHGFMSQFDLRCDRDETFCATSLLSRNCRQSKLPASAH